MHITIIEEKKILIESMEQVKYEITSFVEIASGTVSLLLVQHLLTLNEEAEKYLGIGGMFFIQLRQSYYILKKGTARHSYGNKFFCTRLDISDVDNWNKLKRFITWL